MHFTTAGNCHEEGIKKHTMVMVGRYFIIEIECTYAHLHPQVSHHNNNINTQGSTGTLQLHDVRNVKEEYICDIICAKKYVNLGNKIF